MTYPVVSLIGSMAYYFTYSGDAMYAANTSDQFVETVTHTVAGATVKPGKLAFGTHRVGSSTTKTLTLTSAGSAPLVVSAVTSTGAPFTVTGNTCAGKALTRGQTCRVAVTFHPAKAGSFSRSLTVVDGAPTSPLQVPRPVRPACTCMGCPLTVMRRRVSSGWGAKSRARSAMWWPSEADGHHIADLVLTTVQLHPGADHLGEQLADADAVTMPTCR